MVNTDLLFVSLLKFASPSNLFKYIYIYIYKKKKEALWVSRKYIKKNWRAAGSWPSGLAVTICDDRAARR